MVYVPCVAVAGLVINYPYFFPRLRVVFTWCPIGIIIQNIFRFIAVPPSSTLKFYLFSRTSYTACDA